jgi:hypothetical protein
MAALRKEPVSSGATRAFVIPEKGLIPEGVAYDPVSKSFFVSSVAHRKILRIDAKGRISEFVVPRRDGLRSALGMRVDPKTRTLWVASEAIPSMDGFVKDQPLSAAIFEYDVDTGKLRKEHLPPAQGEPSGIRRPHGRSRRPGLCQRRLPFADLDVGARRKVRGVRRIGRARGHAGTGPRSGWQDALRFRLSGALRDRRRDQEDHPDPRSARSRAQRHRRPRLVRWRPRRDPERSATAPGHPTGSGAGRHLDREGASWR